VEADTLMAKLQFEMARYKDLEGVLVLERKNGHELKLETEDLRRQTTLFR
jgi:hypothetical protein